MNLFIFRQNKFAQSCCWVNNSLLQVAIMTECYRGDTVADGIMATRLVLWEFYSVFRCSLPTANRSMY